MKIGLKQTITLFLVAGASMLVIGLISYNKASISLEEESFNRLTAVREMKAAQIEDYFQQINDHITIFSEDPTVVRAMKEFKLGFNSIAEEFGSSQEKLDSVNLRLDGYLNEEYLARLNSNLDEKATLDEESTKKFNARLMQFLYIASNPSPVGQKYLLDAAGDKSNYTKTHALYHPTLTKYLQKFGFYDIFLVDDKTGDIVYTVFKEVDFGTSLVDGPFRQTNLAEAFHATRNAIKPGFVKLVDFKAYHPSYNASAAFIATPIFDGAERIGVLIFQLPIDRINTIMTNKLQWSKVGLGVSGETYIVGEDYTLRNQSRFLIEDSTNYFKMIRDIGMPAKTINRIKAFNSSIGLQEVKTLGTEAALSGETDAKIFPDYRGVPVLSAYRPLNIQGMHWVIMSEIDEAEAFSHVHTLRNYMFIGFCVLLVVVIIVSFVISRSMTRPLKILTYDAKELARGNFDVEIGIRRKDEIGILALSFRSMQSSIKKLVDELKEINLNLENKVKERTADLQTQKELVEDKNKEILDSINYAKRLQSAILPPVDKIHKNLKNAFVLFKPKDIVSGDFYWMYKRDDDILIAAVDCTGHGVPGAMVSVVGANNLDRCVREFNLRKPSSILDKMCELVVATFETTSEDVRDGMDMSLVCIDTKDRKIQYSGANNPIWIIRKGLKVIEEIKADKQPIGKYEFAKPFTNHVIQLDKGDTFYLFSDGFADQFGGPNGKKFKYKTLKELLVNINVLSMEEQHEHLHQKFEEWKGELDQIDDVCVIGVRL